MGKIVTIYSFPNIVSTDKVKVEATKEVKLKFKIRVVGLRNKKLFSPSVILLKILCIVFYFD